MTAKHTEDLPTTTLDGTEKVHVVDGGNSRQTTVADIAALAVGGAANAELIRDTIAAALVAGASITITPNDGADTIAIACSLTQYTDEMARDAIGAALAAATGATGGVTITVNDGADTITIGLASSAFQTLTDAATIAWDMSAGYNAKVTLGGNRTAGTPTNPVEGRTYSLLLIQDGTGSRTWTPAASMKFGSAGNPTLSTGAGKKDMVFLQCIDSATPEFRCSFNKDA
jgi:hypothetical protein